MPMKYGLTLEKVTLTDYEMLMVVMTIIGLVLVSKNSHKNNHR